MELNTLTGLIVDIALRIHKRVGPACFERVYEEIMVYELEKKGISVERQLLLPINYEELHISNAYKIDLLLEKKLLLELKSVHPLPPVFLQQVNTYLSLLNLKNGMLLNFHVNRMKEGIYRVYNNDGLDELK